MTIKFLALAVVLIFSTHAAAAPCNKNTAQEVQAGLGEFAKQRTEGDHLPVHWVMRSRGCLMRGDFRWSQPTPIWMHA